MQLRTETKLVFGRNFFFTRVKMSIEYEPEVIDQKKSPVKTQNEEKITFEVDLSTGKSFKTL